MKRVRVAIIMLASAVLLGIGSIAATCQVFRDMTEETLRLYSAAQGDNLPEISQVEAFGRKWEKLSGLVALYTRHDEVERVTEAVEMLKPVAIERDSASFRQKCSEVVSALRHMRDTELPKLRNIL